MDGVGAGTSDDSNRTPCSSTGLGSKAMIDDLELLYILERNLRAIAAGELVVVACAINEDRIAAWSQAAKAETAAGKRGSVLRRSCIGRRDPRGQKNKVEEVPALDG